MISSEYFVLRDKRYFSVKGEDRCCGWRYKNGEIIKDFFKYQKSHEIPALYCLIRRTFISREHLFFNKIPINKLKEAKQ